MINNNNEISVGIRMILFVTQNHARLKPNRATKRINCVHQNIRGSIYKSLYDKLFFLHKYSKERLSTVSFFIYK
jgi:hypothetical protein